MEERIILIKTYTAIAIWRHGQGAGEAEREEAHEGDDGGLEEHFDGYSDLILTVEFEILDLLFLRPKLCGRNKK